MAVITPGFSAYPDSGFAPTVLIRATIHPGYSQETTQGPVAAAIYGHVISPGTAHTTSSGHSPWRVQTAILPTPKARTLTL